MLDEDAATELAQLAGVLREATPAPSPGHGNIFGESTALASEFEGRPPSGGLAVYDANADGALDLLYLSYANYDAFQIPNGNQLHLTQLPSGRIGEGMDITRRMWTDVLHSGYTDYALPGFDFIRPNERCVTYISMWDDWFMSYCDDKAAVCCQGRDGAFEVLQDLGYVTHAIAQEACLARDMMLPVPANEVQMVMLSFWFFCVDRVGFHFCSNEAYVNALCARMRRLPVDS